MAHLLMRMKKMRRESDIDLDELDELPDVVLGEKTRALRVEEKVEESI